MRTVVLSETELAEVRALIMKANDQQQHAEALDCLFTVLTLLEMVFSPDLPEAPK